MQHSAKPSFLVLLGAFGTFCLVAFGLLLEWALCRLLPRARWPRMLGRVVRVTIVLLAAAGLLVAVYARWIEPNWLAVEHVRVHSSKLPAGAKPIRIVQISDLHCEAEVRLEDELAGVIEAQQPDLIAFTGDAANGREGIAVFRKLMGRLAELAPTFVIYGTGDGPVKEARPLEGTRAVELTGGEGVLLDVKGTPVRVLGNSWGRIRIPEAQPNLPAPLTILLCHYPTVGVRALPGSAVDLCLSGNTHGGQVRLPLLGPIAGSRAEQKYVAGLYKVGNSWLYVNRGIGMSDHAPRFRLGARPEVTVIEIRTVE